MNIKVDFYEKTTSHCTFCKSMMNVLNTWIENSSDKVEVSTHSIEENLGSLIAEGVQAKAAPVVIVERGKNITVISGNNPDILVDALNGKSSIWD